MKTDDILNPAFTDDHFLVWLLPGATVLLPTTFIINKYLPLSGAWGANQWLFAGAFILAAIGIGATLESFGGWIESEVFDKRLQEKEGHHKGDWNAYLVTPLSPDLVAHRYIRHRVRLMKFELAELLAVLLALVACWWLFIAQVAFSWTSMILGTIAVAALARYLYWDAFEMAKLLSDLRRQLLDPRARPGVTTPRQIMDEEDA